MDFDEAVAAHVRWKSKLAAYVAKPDRSLNSAQISLDSQCELGKWLHGEGRKHSQLSDYVQLVADHARFHREAGQIVRKADAGEKMTEEVCIGAKSEYAAASNAVIGAIMKVKRLVSA